MREIIIKNRKDTDVTDESLYALDKESHRMWPKSMIESYFEDIKKAPHLIPIGSEERKRTIENKLSFIPERLFPFFWKTIFFELSKSIEDGNANGQKFLMWMAVKFLIDNRVDINAPQYSLAIQVRDYPQICWTLFFVPKVWQKTDSEYQNQLFRYLANNLINKSRKSYNKALSLLHNAAHFAKWALERYVQTIPWPSLAQNCIRYVPSTRPWSLALSMASANVLTANLTHLSLMTRYMSGNLLASAFWLSLKYVYSCCIIMTYFTIRVQN